VKLLGTGKERKGKDRKAKEPIPEKTVKLGNGSRAAGYNYPHFPKLGTLGFQPSS